MRKPRYYREALHCLKEEWSQSDITPIAHYYVGKSEDKDLSFLTLAIDKKQDLFFILDEVCASKEYSSCHEVGVITLDQFQAIQKINLNLQSIKLLYAEKT